MVRKSELLCWPNAKGR
uniref:Uncharacterized protein n=1 Tax=Arundo donax TaxID=35708 RepID=A0A0A9FBL5_ARUDO